MHHHDLYVSVEIIAYLTYIYVCIIFMIGKKYYRNACYGTKISLQHRLNRLAYILSDNCNGTKFTTKLLGTYLQDIVNRLYSRVSTLYKHVCVCAYSITSNISTLSQENFYSRLYWNYNLRLSEHQLSTSIRFQEKYVFRWFHTTFFAFDS